MAILIADGFDHITGSSTYIKYTPTSANISSSSTTRYNRGNSIKINQGIGALGLVYSIANSGTVILDQALLLDNSNTLVFCGYDTADASRNQWVVSLEMASGLIKGYRNGFVQNNIFGATLIGDSSSAAWRYTPNVWNWVSIKVVTHSTTGSIEVKVNGVTRLSLTGINTRGQTSNNYVNKIGVGVTGNDVYMDDMVWMDNSGSTLNDHLDEVTIRTYYPTANSTPMDWTASAGSQYTCIDEAQHNSDTDYISSSTVGHESLFTTGSMPSNMSDIKAIQVGIVSRKDDASTRLLRSLIKPGSTIYESSDMTQISTYAYYSQIYTTNPDTSVAWTPSDLNSLKFGVKVQS